MKLTAIEKEYIDAYKSQSTTLESIFSKAKNSDLALGYNDFTQCLIQRLKAYYETQNNIKEFLNKRYAASAADYFVESVLYFLKLALEISNPKLEVHSERKIIQSKNSI